MATQLGVDMNVKGTVRLTEAGARTANAKRSASMAEFKPGDTVTERLWLLFFIFGGPNVKGEQPFQDGRLVFECESMTLTDVRLDLHPEE